MGIGVEMILPVSPGVARSAISTGLSDGRTDSRSRSRSRMAIASAFVICVLPCWAS